MKVPLFALLLIAACLTVPTAARGGRGRGGGSVGGLFGGWRKYKKPSSSGSGRRVMNGSPVHTAMSVPKPPPPPPPPQRPAISVASKPQMSNYPRQQMPSGYSYANGPGNTPIQPTYYANSQALPAGAMFYAQPPMRSTGTGDFLTGMLAGHMMNTMLFGHRQRGTHVYHDNQAAGVAQPQANGREIIIINNGEQQLREEESDAVPTEEPQPPNNESLEPDATASNEDSSELVSSASQELSSSESPDATTGPMDVPPGTIVCFPIMVNETDSEDESQVHEVERIICFPAPPAHQPIPSVECETRTYFEPDPADPTKTLEVHRQHCGDESASTTTTEPPIVAGDIGATATAPDEASQT